MSYGVPERRPGPPFGRSTKGASRPFIQRALELGVNFFGHGQRCTSDGTSEEIVRGGPSPTSRPREEVVIATKVPRGAMPPEGANGGRSVPRGDS